MDNGNNMFGVPGFGPPPPPRNDIDAIYRAYQQALAALQSNPMYNNSRIPPQQPPQPQPNNSNPAMGQRGMFVQVNDYNDVATYPVAPDGMPTLFFDYTHGIFWSKKLLDGKTVIQDFVFAPRGGLENGNVQNEQDIPDLDDLPDLSNQTSNESMMNAILDRLQALSEKVDSIFINKDKEGE